jgi:hypothetical protein
VSVRGEDRKDGVVFGMQRLMAQPHVKTSCQVSIDHVIVMITVVFWTLAERQCGMYLNISE